MVLDLRKLYEGRPFWRVLQFFLLSDTSFAISINPFLYYYKTIYLSTKGEELPKNKKKGHVGFILA